MLYHRHHHKQLLDNLPPANAMPYLQRIHGLPPPPPVQHTTTSIPDQRRGQSVIDLALPDFKTLLDDLSGGGGSGGSAGSGTLVESPGASGRGWNPLVASRSSSATQHSIELRV